MRRERKNSNVKTRLLGISRDSRFETPDDWDWSAAPSPAPGRGSFIGLGDMVEVFAKPVGCMLDRMTKALRLPATTFCAEQPNCGCARRKAKFNNLVPDVTSAAAWRAACKAVWLTLFKPRGGR